MSETVDIELSGEAKAFVLSASNAALTMEAEAERLAQSSRVLVAAATALRVELLERARSSLGIEARPLGLVLGSGRTSVRFFSNDLSLTADSDASV